MSYILEALRKAQAERERGQVPGLEARSLADGPPVPADTRASLRRGAAAGLVMVAVALAGLGLWRLLGAPQTPRAAVVAVAPAAVAPAVPVAVPGGTPGVAAAVSTVAAPAPPEQPAVAALPVVVSAPPAVPPRPAAQAAPATASTPAAAAAAFAPPAAAPDATSTPAPANATAAIREARLAQLPPELRRELPPLRVGGSMWSTSAGSRFVIVDGQVLREGESAAAGVVVERIAQKAAWLRWRDWRIELAF